LTESGSQAQGLGVTNNDLWSDHALAYTLLRLTLGVTIFVHGANRILHGPQNFAAGMDKDFAGTIMPAFMVHSFGLTLPFFETVVGALLLVGLLTRAALLVGALLMAALVLGTTLREQFMIVGIQLIYAAIYFVLISNLRHNSISLDRFLLRRSG
jgi:thiosulfate dehydrogenase (quinone) large subunit